MLAFFSWLNWLLPCNLLCFLPCFLSCMCSNVWLTNFPSWVLHCNCPPSFLCFYPHKLLLFCWFRSCLCPCIISHHFLVGSNGVLADFFLRIVRFVWTLAFLVVCFVAICFLACLFALLFACILLFFIDCFHAFHLREIFLMLGWTLTISKVEISQFPLFALMLAIYLMFWCLPAWLAFVCKI